MREEADIGRYAVLGNRYTRFVGKITLISRRIISGDRNIIGAGGETEIVDGICSNIADIQYAGIESRRGPIIYFIAFQACYRRSIRVCCRGIPGEAPRGIRSAAASATSAAVVTIVGGFSVKRSSGATFTPC